MLRNCRKLIVSFIKSLLILALLMITTTTFAQTQKGGFVLSGKVISSEADEPLEMVLVKLSTSSWAMTNEKGEFKITGLKQGTYKYEITYLGFETVVGEIKISKNITDFKIVMRPMGLGLEEIVVTAEEHKMGSASTIGQAAIQHLQAKSVEDMLQLLPGQITKNPDLTNAGQASIREIDAGSNSNNSLGTAVIVDGAPMSNDANMQLFSTAKSGSNSSLQTNTMNQQSTSGRGVDLRSISPDNIESIEVIRGIPSAEYGNLTSGAVVIKTKVGTTPYEAKVKIDPNSKLVYVGKGFTMKKNRGAINLSADYTKSYEDTRKKYKGYDRITANGAYSNTFMKETTPLSLNLKLSYFRNLSAQKADESMHPDELLENASQGFRFSADGMWRLNKSWISNLNYSASLSYTKQTDTYRQHVTGSVKPYANTRVPGEFVVPFLAAEYLSQYSINGKPLTAYAQLKANKMFSFERGTNNIKVGADYNLSANYGEGMLFNDATPPSSGDGQGARPRSYKSIPEMHTMSYFLENSTEVSFAGTTLNLQAGVRVNTLFIDELAKRGNMTTIDPRINMSYQFLSHENNKVFDDLSIIGGFGYASKMPTMSYLYPNPAYFDYTSFNSYVENDPLRTLAVITSDVVQNTANANLKPSTSRKFEIGLSGRINKFRGTITYFNETYKNEYGFAPVPYYLEYDKYYLPKNSTTTLYPMYIEGEGVYYTSAPGGPKDMADKFTQRRVTTYSMPSNTSETFKQGIEYSFNLGEIKAIKTDVIVDGAWYYIKRRSTGPSYNYDETSVSKTTVGGATASGFNTYLAVMPTGSGSINQRVNTNIRLVTHIPSIKLVFTTTAQIVWYESSKYIYEDDNGNNLYHKTIDEQGSEVFLVDPLGYYDSEGNYTVWDRSMTKNTELRDLPTRTSNMSYYETQTYPITCMLNFKMTKEFKKFVELSFVANNFLKLSNLYRQEKRGGYRELYSPIYFGAELKIKI